MKALILAAGIGKRLKPITDDIPKCLIDVGGKTIIEYLLDNFNSVGIKETIIVVGFNNEAVQKKIGNFYQAMEIKYVLNKDFSTTNNLYSLWCARDLIDDSFIQCHGDIIFNKEILKKLIRSPRENVIVIDSDLENFVEDANRVRLRLGKVIEINKTLPKKESAGRAFGLYKFSKKGAENYYKNIKENSHKIKDGFETGLRPTLEEISFGAIDIKGLPYAEIDDINDLESAKKKIKYILEYDNKKF